MTDALGGATSTHWLARLATRAKWANAEAITVPQATGIADVWAAVTRTCGVSDDQLVAELAKSYRLQPARWDTVEPQATKLVPERLARRHHVFPLREDYRTIYVATSDPNDMAAEQEIGFSSGRKPLFVVATPHAIATSIEAGYAGLLTANTLVQAAGADLENAVRVAEQAAPEAVKAEEAAAAPVVALANLILRDGVASRASDIHIEPGRQSGHVRFRVDGVMREYLQLAMPVFNRVVSRIKVMGGLDIADRMRPQDGRARILLPDGHAIDLRLSTVPTRESEKAVIRLLDSSSSRTLADAGLSADALARLRRLIAHRDGIVLLTGPTGSGKTTTLYGAIRELCDGQVNIMTIEDPVEYEVPGITQIQVETKRGVTFASALRAVLRQDPDIVFVGEIRDGETATTAAHAALTGHLVLSTLHTNDAIGVIARLADLGLDRATIATSLRGVVAQRLLRKLCDCAASVTGELTPEEARLSTLTGVRPVKRVRGCDKCAQTGYFGRLPVAEVFMVSTAIEPLIATDQPATVIAARAHAEGMRTLPDVAIDLVAQGLTTLDEAERVIGISERVAALARTKVLIADDDPVIRAIAARVLEDEGYEVEQVADGESALARASSATPPDVVILDINMPKLDGRHVLAKLRSAPATQRLPVLILTASEDESLEAELMDEGADDYLRKPLEPARFTARIRAVLRRTRMR
ncbi:MAG: Flp pilus assembly complex ATPase component TadA [Gemmatimonadetes bacterium]|nr:Flp pilus assembly complex ATPase component TadA [Gemmatimonadota bacterium]